MKLGREATILRSRSDHTKVAQRPPETRERSDPTKVAQRPPKVESAAKLQLSCYYKCAIPSFLVILRIDGVVQGVGNEESGDSAKSRDSEILTKPTQTILLAPKAALKQQAADLPYSGGFLIANCAGKKCTAPCLQGVSIMEMTHNIIVAQ